MAVLSSGSLLLIVSVCLTQLLTSAHGASESEVLDRLLGQKKLTLRPNSDDEKGSPTKVTVNFYARDFYVLDHSMRFLGTQLTFRQEWNDPRLVYPEDSLEYLTLKDPGVIWKPDIFFSNSREGRFNDLMEPNLLFRIYPNGDVKYSRRITLDFRCWTDARLFPLSKVVCPVILASYGYTTDAVDLEWKDVNPVQMSKSLDLPSYTVYFNGTSTCNSKTVTGEYSCLRSDFVLEPRYCAVFSMLYLPPLFLVSLGWLSFFLHQRRSKVRLNFLLVLLLLGCLACANSAWKKPDRMTQNAADVWSGICLSFVTYALLHFLMTRHVPCLARLCGYDEERATRTHVDMQPMIGSELQDKGKDENKPGNKFQFTSARIRHLVTKAGNRADIVARMFYPTAFIIANIIYWALYKAE